MHVLKRLLRGLAAATLGLILLLLAGALTWSRTLGRQDTVKSWLNSSGVYTKAPDVFLAQIPQNEDQNNQLNDPQVRQIVKEVISPDLLKQQTENVVSGVYDWLEGKVSTPDFRLDLTSAKDQFVSKISAYAKQRVHSLPTCSRRNLPPPDTDPLSLTCVPPRVNIDAMVDRWAAGLFSGGDQPFNTVITAQNLNKDGSNPFDKLQAAPRVFQAMRPALYVLGALTLIMSVLIFWLNEDKARAWRVVGRAFLSAGIVLLIGAVVALLMVGRLGNQTVSSPADVMGNLGWPLLRTASSDIARIQLWLGAIYTLIAVVAFVLIKRLKPRTAVKK